MRVPLLEVSPIEIPLHLTNCSCLDPIEALANEYQHLVDPLAEGGKMCRQGHSPGLIETRKWTLEIGQSRAFAEIRYKETYLNDVLFWWVIFTKPTI